MSLHSLTPAVGPDDHAQGSPRTPVTLVEYGDYECPFCGMAYPVVREIRRRMGRALRFVYRHFPSSIATRNMPPRSPRPRTTRASSGRCTTCSSATTGTPTFFINGVRQDGEWDDGSLLIALRAAAFAPAAGR